MTEQMVFTSAVGYPPEILYPGDITLSWCHIHGPMTKKLWTGHELVCLECHPEKKPEEEKKNGIN